MKGAPTDDVPNIFGAGHIWAELFAPGRRLLVVDPVGVDDDIVGDFTEIMTSLCARRYGRGARTAFSARSAL